MHRNTRPPRVTPADRLDELPVRDHARRHIAECFCLGKLPQLADLRLAAWTHMLGFRGRFSTKSRAYSITLGSLRADRAAYQRERAVAAGLLPAADDITLVVADWHYAGSRGPAIRRGPARRCRRLRATFATGRCAVPRLLLTVPEAAEALAISRSKLYELLASGDIASIRIDGSRRIPLTALESTSPGSSPKGPPPDDRHQAAPPPQGHRKGRLQAPRWRYETRGHLVVCDPRQGPGDRRQQAALGGRLRDRRSGQGRPRREPGQGRRGEYVDRNRITVAAYLDDWIDSHAMEIKPRTLQDYRSCLRLYVTPRIGHLQVQALRPSTITKLYRDLLTSGGRDGQPLAVATVTHLHAVLRKAFRDAEIVDEIINSNPVERAKRPRAQAHEPGTVWNVAQLRAFLATARQHRLFAFFHVAAYTGARRGELLNLC